MHEIVLAYELRWCFPQQAIYDKERLVKNGSGLLREACLILSDVLYPDNRGCQFLRSHCLILQNQVRLRTFQGMKNYTAPKGRTPMTAIIPEIAGNLSVSLQQQLARVASQWTTHQGIQGTAIDGLELIRCNEPSSCGSSVYEPSLCFVIQGTKSIQLGDRQITYEPLSYLASSVHLPVLGRIIEASDERPYLAAKLKVDAQEVAELVLEMGDKAPPLQPGESCPEIQCGLCVSSMGEELQGGLYRLLRLLDYPGDIPILAPLARREIIYRVLVGEMGSRMRRFAASDTHAHRISTVISALKDHYAEPLRISELAEAANMSESTLYHSFKQVTRMSPLQFQKKLRLHEARRLMLTEGLEAATASYRVGYESPSHFSREYSRMFGAPPKADVTLLRGEWEIPDPVF